MKNITTQKLEELLKKQFGNKYKFEDDILDKLMQIVENRTEEEILNILKVAKERVQVNTNVYYAVDVKMNRIVNLIKKSEMVDEKSLKGLLQEQFNEELGFEEFLGELLPVFAGRTNREVSNILNGAKKKMILAHKEGFFNIKYYGNLKIVIEDIIKEKDLELYKQINKINEQLKSSFTSKEEKKGLIKTMKTLWELISQSDKKINNDITNFTEKSLKIFEGLAAIYSSLVEVIGTDNYDGERGCDMAILEIASKLQSNTLELFDDTQVRLIKEFLKKSVKSDSNNDDELFTKSEMRKLIQQAPSILGFITIEKFNSIKQILNDHIEIAENVYDVKFNKKAKDVILNSGTILTAKQSNLLFALQMLLGANGSEALDVAEQEFNMEKSRNIPQQAKDVFSGILKNIKIQNLNSETFEFFLNNPTFLTRFTPTNIYSKISDISYAMCKVYATDEEMEELGTDMSAHINFLKEKGFDVTTILNKDNIGILCDRTVILSKKQNGKNPKYGDKIQSLIDNSTILSKLIGIDEIHKIISHNLLFLLQDKEKMEEEIRLLAKQSCGDINKFKKNINEFVNKVIDVDSPTHKKIKKANVTVSKTSSSKTSRGTRSNIIEKEKININNFQFDNELMEELGFDTILQEPEQEIIPPKQITSEELLKQIEDELDGIYYYDNISSIKLDKETSSTIMKKVIERLKLNNNSSEENSQTEKQIKNYADILTDITKLRMKINKYCQIASEDEIEYLLEYVKSKQEIGEQFRTSLKEKIVAGKEILVENRPKTNKEINAHELAKINDHIEKDFKGKRKESKLLAVGIIKPDIKGKIEEAEVRQQQIAENRSDYKTLHDEITTDIIVLKVYEKLKVMLEQALKDSTENLELEKEDQSRIDEINAKKRELEAMLEELKRKIADEQTTIEKKDRELQHYRRSTGVKSFKSPYLKREEAKNKSRQGKIDLLKDEISKIEQEIKNL